MTVDFVGFAKGAENVAKMMAEANAAYVCVGASEVDDGPSVVLMVLVRGEAECREIQSACDRISDSWNSKPSWYAVWDTEYPDEGAVHVKARCEFDAKTAGAIDLDLDPEMLDLEPDMVSCSKVTQEQHDKWLASNE
jgi:hypothetical protein